VRALALAGSGRVPSTASTTTTPALTHMPKRSGMGALITWSEPLRRSRHPVGNLTFKTTVHPRTEPDRPGCWGRRSAPLTTHHARPESILATGGRLDAGAPRRRKRRAMEPVDHPSALCGQLVSPIGESSRSTALRSSRRIRRRSGCCCATKAHAVRVDAIGRAAEAPTQQTGPCGERGGHIKNGLAPAASSCWASRWPRPPAPSIAQVRSGQVPAQLWCVDHRHANDKKYTFPIDQAFQVRGESAFGHGWMVPSQGIGSAPGQQASQLDIRESTAGLLAAPPVQGRGLPTRS
jgi:hypothetical protein